MKSFRDFVCVMLFVFGFLNLGVGVRALIREGRADNFVVGVGCLVVLLLNLYVRGRS